MNQNGESTIPASMKPFGDQSQRTVLLKLGAGVLILVTLLILGRYFPLSEWLGDFNRWVRELGWMGMLLFVVVYIIATVLLVPGLLLSIGAGYAFGFAWGLPLASVASTMGAGVAFLLGRTFARNQLERITRDRPDFQNIDRALAKNGVLLIVLLRISPLVPFNLSNYFYGLTAVKFWPYLLASWVGMIPGTVVNVFFGSVGRAGVDAAQAGDGGISPLQWIMLGVGVSVTILVSVWATRIARQALQQKTNPSSSGSDH